MKVGSNCHETVFDEEVDLSDLAIFEHDGERLDLFRLQFYGDGSILRLPAAPDCSCNEDKRERAATSSPTHTIWKKRTLKHWTIAPNKKPINESGLQLTALRGRIKIIP
jgi:hypothetical protein